MRKPSQAMPFKFIHALMFTATMALSLNLYSPIEAIADDTAKPEVATPWPGGTWAPGEAVYGSKLEKQTAVKMRDGTLVYADISYPTDPATGEKAHGPFPVLLTQTPYLNTKPTAGDYFVKRGYIFVTAYIRGTTTSGGEFGFFDENEAKDGAELVKWAATQLENSNGVVGLNGGSYAGINQFLTAAELGPHSPVKALAPYCMGAELYREPYYAGGIPTQTLNFQRVIGSAMGGKTAKSGQSFLDEVTSGGARAYDGTFWDLRTAGNLAQKIADAELPVLLWSNEGDIYAQSSLELYTYLQNASSKRPVFQKMGKDQKPSGKIHIVMGQGGHCENIDDRITLEWYDTWLKGAKTGIDQTSMPIHVHEMISNRWFNTGVYPPVSNYTRYYLSADRTLSQNLPNTTTKDAITWAQPGAGSVLQYDSPVFTEGATIAGPISASIYASSNTSNIELIATVEAVDPDGGVTKVSSGTLLASLSENDPERSWSDAAGIPVRPYGRYLDDKPIAPGSIRRYDFAVSSRFVSIPPGSKLRLTLTTQTPTDKCSPSLGLDPCFPTAPQAASLAGNITTLYFGPQNSSSLNLPLAQFKCWASSDNPGIPFWKDDAPVAGDGPCQVRADD
ncbi:CocE/NonD family hydrolase [Rhizobium sp. 2YAF20]|uniref:CocE/NonD family hydrolase n=1 Tax=Rhizobium sp. 2YAF20 TaxID=3233027 RepID=UPI003F9ACE3C